METYSGSGFTIIVIIIHCSLTDKKSHANFPPIKHWFHCFANDIGLSNKMGYAEFNTIFRQDSSFENGSFEIGNCNIGIVSY